jgi:hypothetical protein
MQSIKLKNLNKKGTTMSLKTIIEMALWMVAGVALITIIVLIISGDASYVINSAFRSLKSIFSGI